MVKNILNLEGAQELTISEQKSIKEGLACTPEGSCPQGAYCDFGTDLCKQY